MLKQFTYYQINVNKLSHLLADDLFNDNCTLIFDAKTGKHIGYIQNANVIEFDTPEDEVIELPQPDKNQLSLNF